LVAHDSALPWLDAAQGKVHWASYCPDGVNPSDINLNLDEQLRPVASLEEAFSDVVAAIEEDSLQSAVESEIGDADDEHEVFNLEDAVKVRLLKAMFVNGGSKKSREQFNWQPESYDRHIQTLLTTIREPIESRTRATLIDLASCVLAARLTKHFIRFRHIQPNTKRTATPPGLSCPTASRRELRIGWDGLFTLIFSLVDFLDDAGEEVEFKFSELVNEPEWVALIVGRVPDFSHAPKDFYNARRLSEKYCQIAKSTLLDDHGQAAGWWKYSVEGSEVTLRLHAPLGNTAEQQDE